MKFFERMNENRVPWVLGVFFLVSIPLAILFLCGMAAINSSGESYWVKMGIILKDYSTIVLALGSLPVAFVLWLFRNHDIVMNLDLNRYHEAVKNIHNQKASVGLRQVAFETLMELKKKPTWDKKIREDVFPGANLKELNLDEADLQNANLQEADLQKASLQETILVNAKLKGAELGEADLKIANLYNANLRGAKLNGAKLGFANLERAQLHDAELKGANLQGNTNPQENTILKKAELYDADLTGAKLQLANLEGAKLHRANLTGIELEGTNLHKAELDDAYYYSGNYIGEFSTINKKKTLVNKKWLDYKNALNWETVKGINLIGADLTNVQLAGVDLTEIDLTGAYYYKNEEDRQNKKQTPVNKKWLREEKGALNVDKAIGIPEE